MKFFPGFNLLVNWLFTELLNSGGFTVYIVATRLHHGGVSYRVSEPKTGYVVNCPKLTRTVKLQKFTRTDVARYLKRHLKYDVPVLIGGWKDMETFHAELARPEVFESFNIANREAIKRGERYVWDVTEKRDIPAIIHEETALAS